jgi:Ner family transcriptional regulator
MPSTIDAANKTEQTHRVWHPEEIKTAIRIRSGGSMREFARSHGLTGQAFSLTLYRRHWPKVEQIISLYIGIPVQELWPERYEPDGAERPDLKSRLREGDW